jgi:predicted naringenin-chalcone synthase
LKPIYINRFEIINPKHCYPQTVLNQWITKAHQNANQYLSTTNQMDDALLAKLFIRYGVGPAQISQRYFECDDVLGIENPQSQIYTLTADSPRGADISARTKFFSTRALEVMNQFYIEPKAFTMPDHLIHVTCTGYTSPSAAQRLIANPERKKSTDITHAYHMGCYGAFPAIRMASSIASSQNHQVDIVHNEMCGLHMNCATHTPEQIIVQTLFADGHAKYTISQNALPNGENLKILGVSEALLPNSHDDMSWEPSPFGMTMTLTRDVPERIRLAIKEFSESLLNKVGVNYSELKDAVFAIHPGGPRIIDVVKETLELSESQLTESRKILFERGNMSSATLPHIWHEVLGKHHPKGTKIVSFAFGPGLTVFGAVFEVA